MKRYEILGIDVTDDLISVSIECIRERSQDERNPFTTIWGPTGKIKYTFKFKCMSELTIMSDYVNVVDLVDVTDTSELTKLWVANHKDMPHLKLSGGSEFEAMLKAYQLMGCVFLDNDWSLEEVEVHKPSLTALEVNLSTTTNKKEEGNPKMTNKHKLYDMIVAKAANMKLVIFSKHDSGWVESYFEDLVCWPDCEFFLCLPQYKDVCLRWLNGSDVQAEDPRKAGSFGDFVPFIDGKHWVSTGWYMKSGKNVRVKPNKEKRLIASFPWGGNKNYVTPKSFPTIRELHEYVDIHYGKKHSMQIHEIEVEL